ncbi:BglG family transcription antiterminator [Gemella cuniculi]|uniref:BglG family transcription antiterminator n=1 Tax=Gemella cuniculi TaxID=150240 RepID=UPI000421BA92|nr:PRD domain-containing protein [Gemella cuniculi]
MTELEKREIEILRILTEEKDYLPVYIIAEKLGVSTKTAYRDIEKIIEKRNDIALLKKQGKGIKVKFSEIPLELTQQKKVSKHSVEERRIKILYYLLKNSKEYTSIEELSDKYFVGKSSIVNDLSYIENNLLHGDLELKKDRFGTKIVGEEKNIRKRLMCLVRNYSIISDDDIGDYHSERIEEGILKELASKFDIPKIATIEKIVNNNEHRLPYTIGDLYYTNLIVHILIAMERINNGNYIEENKLPQISDKKFYGEAENIAAELEREFSVTLPLIEIYYIYQYLVSTGVGNLNNDISLKVDESVEKITKKFLLAISNDRKSTFNMQDNIYYLFKLHIRALLRRLKYDIVIKNPLLEKIKEEYKEQFKKIEDISKEILSEKITEDEVAYLTIYIESILNLNNVNKKVVLVCHSGFGTSIFLKKRIEDKLDNLEVVDVISAKDLEEYDLEKIDFIISTVKLGSDIKNVVYVNVMLKDEDILNINRKVYGENNEI